MRRQSRPGWRLGRGAAERRCALRAGATVSVSVSVSVSVFVFAVAGAGLTGQAAGSVRAAATHPGHARVHPHACRPRTKPRLVCVSMRSLLQGVHPRRGVALWLQIVSLLDSPSTQRALSGPKIKPLATAALGALARAESALVRGIWAHSSAARPAVAHAANSGFQRIAPGPGEIGSGEFATGTAGSGRLGMTLDVGSEGFAARCPDFLGDVSGHARFRLGQTVAGANGGASAAYGYSLDASGRATGHVGKDGKLSDFDLVVKTTIVLSVSGSGGGHSAHTSQTYSSTIAYFHVVPGSPATQWTAQVNSNVISTSPNATASLTLLESLGAVAVEGEAANAFAAAQTVWYDQAACLKATFNPASLDKLQGTSGPVKVGVTAVSDGRPVTLSLNATAGGGSVTPAQARAASSPATFDFTFAQPHYGSSYLHVDGVSERGRVEDSVVGNEPSLAVVDTESSTASVSFPYDFSSGTYVNRGTHSEQRNVVLSSQVPLAHPPLPLGGPLSGSAPMNWQSYSWTRDDDNTSTSNGGGLCTIDTNLTLTSVTPGTLKVKSLRINTPGQGGTPQIALDLVVSGALENWHQAETTQSGPCPAFQSDFTANYLLGDLTAFHRASNLGGNNGYEFQINSGWQPGRGNVIATQTITGTLPYPYPATSGQVIHFTDTLQVIRPGG